MYARMWCRSNEDTSSRRSRVCSMSVRIIDPIVEQCVDNFGA